MAWRDTALSTKILGIDGRAVIPMMIWLMHWSWTTFYVAITGVLIFAVMQKLGISMIALWRKLLRGLFGSAIRRPVPRSRYIRRITRD